MSTSTRRTRKRGDGKLVELPSARRANRFRRWIRRGVIGSLGIVTLVAVVATFWTVGEIRVEGARSTSAEEIVRSSGLDGGDRLLLTRMGGVEERVERLPRIRSATARRALWSAVEIRVVERDPLVRLSGHMELVAGDDGVIFPAPDGASVPEFVGWRPAGSERSVEPGGRLDERSSAVLDGLGSFPDRLRSGARLVSLTEGRLQLVLHDGTEIRFGVPHELEAKAAAAAAVLAEAEARGAALEYVDVRAPATPVAKERGAGSGAEDEAPDTGDADDAGD